MITAADRDANPSLRRTIIPLKLPPLPSPKPPPQPGNGESSTYQAVSTPAPASAAPPPTQAPPAAAPTVTPPGVTKVSDDGKFWMVPGQYITQGGAQVWIPEHWVRAGSITTTAIDQTQITVAPDKTPEQREQDAGRAMIAQNVKSWLFTDDQLTNLGGFMMPLFERNGGSAKEFDQWSHYSIVGIDGEGKDVLPGVPHARFTTYQGSESTLKGKQGLVLSNVDAMRAHDQELEPADYYVRTWITAIRGSNAQSDKATSTGGSSGSSSNPLPPAPAPPAPGNGLGLPPLPGGTTAVTTGPRPGPLPVAQLPAPSSPMNAGLLAIGAALVLYMFSKM